MGVQLRIEGQPITLGDLRQVVEHTAGWPDDSPVEPRGSRVDTASITIEHPGDSTSETTEIRNTRLGG